MDKRRMAVDIERMIDELILDYKMTPVDLLGNDLCAQEYHYLSTHKLDYIRTVRDVVSLFNETNANSAKRILEIGCFLGIVSIVLSKFGFKVTATDIKEFISCKNLQSRFSKNGIAYFECNLRDYKLPFNNEEFDLVIMCEVLEHLNFNPLPVIKEINRITRLNGLFYLALPNIAALPNRLKLLRGESIHNPIKDFFAQLDPNNNMIVGLHWREYTAGEIKHILEEMDFTVIQQRYESSIEYDPSKISARNMIKRLLYILNLGSSLKKKQVALALKKRMSPKKFCFTDATLPR